MTQTTKLKVKVVPEIVSLFHWPRQDEYLFPLVQPATTHSETFSREYALTKTYP